MSCLTTEHSLRSELANISSHRIVEQNITSALVLEDDIDWDLRIKSQMREFARASRLLVQPLHGATDSYLDPTHPEPREDQEYSDFDINSNAVTEPKTSPYGDISRWDLLWLGHCGARFPRASEKNVPLGRVVIPNDETVPEHQHLHMEYGNDDLLKQYEPHTRVVSRSRFNTCSLGYGISQGGARRFLWELGTRKMSDPNDLMFREVCDGVKGRELGMCLTVQPQLFQHHRPVGPRAGFSDISNHGDGYNEIAFTRNVRWSVRLNFRQLISGKTDYTDLFQDGGEKLDLPHG
jgi:hypothetical protein